MKKLLVAFVILVGLGNTAVAQTKVGHVNSAILWDTLASTKKAETQMQDFQTNLATEIQDLEANIRKLYAEYEEMMSSPEPPSNVLRQLKEKKIQEKEAEYQQRQQSIQYEMQAVRAELEAPIVERIKKAVGIVAEREKFNYVIDINNAIYVSEGSDITNMVMVELLKLEEEETTSTNVTPTPGN